MATQIFYFTGTGNSLSIARKINDQLPDSTIHSMVNNKESAGIREDKNIVIVTPVYMYNIPYIVHDFITEIEGKGTCSVILSGGGDHGNTIKKVKKLFKTKEIDLKSVFNVPMPSNYTPFGITDEKTQKKQFTGAETKIEEICSTISKGNSFYDKSNTSFFQCYIHPGIAYTLGYKYINFLDNNFSADEKCNGCSVCFKVCPVNNILMQDNKPLWQNHCQQCFACLQWCPQEAIQYGKKTSNVSRYRNPEISLNDIILSNTIKEDKK